MNREDLIQKILTVVKESEANKWPNSVLIMDLNELLKQEEQSIKDNCIDTIESFRCEEYDYIITELVNAI